jgi:predicted nucleic acid-binding Zn ribbon protein
VPGNVGRSAQLIVPVYVYRRHDGSSFELEQRITVDALVSCPTTGQSVERVMQPFTACYKGTGFYSTDHPKTTPGLVEPISVLVLRPAVSARSRSGSSGEVALHDSS